MEQILVTRVYSMGNEMLVSKLLTGGTILQSVIIKCNTEKMKLMEAVKLDGEARSDLSVPFYPTNECGELNPLDVDLVIKKVLKHLDLDSLRTARSVCRRWNLHATTLVHKRCSKMKIVFTDDQWNEAKTYGLDGMGDFVRYVKKTGECPFGIFDIGTSILIEKGNERVVLEFIAFCGQSIKELTVRDDWDDWDLKQGTHNRGIPKNIQFHRLRKLSFHLVSDSEQDRLELFHSLMKGSPKLANLYFRSTKMDDGEAVEWLIKSLIEFPRKITTLKMFAPVQEAQLLSLSAVGLKLESLSLDLWGSYISDPNIMKSFLYSLSKTLKFLKISDEVRTFLSAIEFPCMEKLETLKIKGSILGGIVISFPSVSYPDQFPSLKSLSFSTLSGEWDSFFKKEMKPSQSVEELKLPCSLRGFSDDRCLRRAAYLFPKLKRLEIPHYQHLLEVVYELLSQLEELTIITNEVGEMDDIITGIPNEICQAINESGCYNVMLKDNRYKLLQTSKSITSLTNLKTFRLKCKRESEPLEITDISCYLGLFLIKSLNCLDFGNRRTMFSPECLRDMQKRYKVICNS